MATMNPFELLGADDNDDPSQLIAAAAAAAAAAAEKPSKKGAPAANDKAAAKLPSKPLPPSQSVREARNEAGRGGYRGGAHNYGGGRDGGGYNRNFSNNNNADGGNNGFPDRVKASEDGERGQSFERRGGPRGPYRGDRRGGYSNGDSGEGERPRRMYERRSGTGQGNEFKREGSGRGNWGAPTDEIVPETEEPIAENEKAVEAEKPQGEAEAVDSIKETPENVPEEKEPEEEKEMTLEEYQIVLEEKRKALVSLKAEERKVDLDKELESMQLLSNKKKNNDEIFIKLGSEKDKRKEAAEKEERPKKSVSINEFLKPAEGKDFHGRGRGGRGRGRGPRGGFGDSGNMNRNVPTPKIEDKSQFPSLGAKKDAIAQEKGAVAQAN